MKRFCLFLILVSVLYISGSVLDEESYWKIRERLLLSDDEKTKGSDLDERERAVNVRLMEMKRDEYERDPFLPSIHFFNAYRSIQETPIFRLLKALPKGGALHIHDPSLVSTKWLVSNLTYRPDLFWCRRDSDGRVLFRFHATNFDECRWHLASESRKTDPGLDILFYSQLTLETDRPHEVYPDLNSVWKMFWAMFDTVSGLIGHEDIFPDYLLRVFEEFYEDNIIYLELRSLLNEVYRDDGSQLSEIEILEIYRKVIAQFKETHPDWYGVRIIYNLVRGEDATLEVAHDYLEVCVQLQKLFPDLVIGFDFVGQEDPGRRLTEYLPTLLEHKNDVQYFFHAGETDWNGLTSENLFDAVLLDTKRIGHGFAITKHPQVMKIAKKKGIAVELNPVSNQVLGLIRDLRNHPGGELLARNHPVVISSDDPSFFASKGVTFDWYEAFIGFASYRDDLNLLKMLAKNSIIYSGLREDEKEQLMKIWKKQWEKFIEEQYSIDYHVCEMEGEQDSCYVK